MDIKVRAPSCLYRGVSLEVPAQRFLYNAERSVLRNAVRTCLRPTVRTEVSAWRCPHSASCAELRGHACTREVPAPSCSHGGVGHRSTGSQMCCSS